jgi:YhgE/Pip-like protein
LTELSEIWYILNKRFKQMFKPKRRETILNEAIIQFLRQPAAKAGIASALMFQVIFSLIWMTGYAGVTERTNQLQIAIVNEDAGIGIAIANQLQSSLPFQSKIAASLEQAQESLEQRETHMVLHIPSSFSSQLQASGQQAELRYYINEANPAMIKSIMQGVSTSITNMVNEQALSAGVQAILVQANVPAQQAQTMTSGLAGKVQAHIESVHPVQGMHNQMLPMMMVLASFVGAMVMQMNFNQASIALGPKLTRWNKLTARSIINVASAILVALVGSSLVVLLDGQAEQGFLYLWGFQTLFLVTFMFVAQLFLLLFGLAGMVFNIVLLSMQLVSSGATVPRELMNPFYTMMGDLLPATYAVEGMTNVLFGGPSAGGAAIKLVIILASSLLLGIAAVAIRKDNTYPQQATAAESMQGLPLLASEAEIRP